MSRNLYEEVEMASSNRSKFLTTVYRCLICSLHSNSRLWLNLNRTLTSSSSQKLSSLLSKLMQQPLFNVKATLDFEDKSSSSGFESPDFSWDALVMALKSSSPRKANLVLEWRLEKFMKEDEKNYDSYSRLISLCGEIQNVETAIRVFSSMEAQGLKPNSSVFNALVSACLSSHNSMTALSLFELMERSEDYKSNADTYNAFILAYAKLGNKKAMQAWYSAKLAAGFSSDFRAYESLILGCVKSKDFVDAEKFYEEMTLAGFIPNSSIMQNMVVVYCEKRNVTQIQKFLKYAVDGSWYISRDTLVKILRLFNEWGSVKDMEELLNSFTNSNQPSEFLSLVHSEIIRMYAKTNRLDDVEFSVGRMLRQGISFIYSEDVEKVISLYFRQGAYDRLDLFLKCIRDSFKFSQSTYDLLIVGYRRAGLQEKLDMLKNDMKLDGFLMS